MKKLLLVFLLLSYKLHAITYLSTGLSTGDAAILSDPRALSFPGSNSAPQIAVAQNGNAVALWTNFPNQIEIQGAFFNAGAPLTPNDIPLTQNAWSTRWTPLIVNPIENPFASVLVNNTDIDFSQFLIDSGFIGIGSAPKMGVDQNGNAIIVFVTMTNQIVAMYFQTHTEPTEDNGTRLILALRNATFLNNPGTSNISPTVAVNNQGVAIAIWIQNIPFQVLSATFTPTENGNGPGVWSPPEIFMPTELQPTGTYPNIGLGYNNDIPSENPSVGTAVWLDGPTGTILTDSFTIPTTIP